MAPQPSVGGCRPSHYGDASCSPAHNVKHRRDRSLSQCPQCSRVCMSEGTCGDANVCAAAHARAHDESSARTARRHESLYRSRMRFMEFNARMRPMKARPARSSLNRCSRRARLQQSSRCCNRTSVWPSPERIVSHDMRATGPRCGRPRVMGAEPAHAGGDRSVVRPCTRLALRQDRRRTTATPPPLPPFQG